MRVTALIAVLQVYCNVDGPRWTAVDVAGPVTCIDGRRWTFIDPLPSSTDQKVVARHSVTAKLTAEPVDGGGRPWTAAESPRSASCTGGPLWTSPEDPDQTTEQKVRRDGSGPHTATSESETPEGWGALTTLMVKDHLSLPSVTRESGRTYRSRPRQMGAGWAQRTHPKPRTIT